MSPARLARSLVIPLLVLCAPAQALDWSDFSSSALVEVMRGPARFTCTGVAISRRVVLTAAHCATGIDSARVSLESLYDPYRGSFTPVQPAGIRVDPQYAPGRSLYVGDVAALTLAQDLPGDIRFAPVLPASLTLAPGTHLELIGYGGRHGQNRRTWTDVIYERTEAGAVFTQDALSAPGDSGGPLFYRSGGTLYLVGIHSTAITDDAQVTAAAVDLRALAGWLGTAARPGLRGAGPSSAPRP